MTQLYTNTIGAATGTTITVDSKAKIASIGQPTQVSMVRTDARLSYVATGNSPFTLKRLDIPFTPLKANSLIVISYMIHYESNENVVWLLFEDYNVLEMGWPSNTYAGIAASYYDADQNSTPSNLHLHWITPAVTTLPRIYSPGFRQSNTGAAQTLTLNRTIGNTGADSYEGLVSTGVVMEIPQ